MIITPYYFYYYVAVFFSSVPSVHSSIPVTIGQNVTGDMVEITVLVNYNFFYQIKNNCNIKQYHVIKTYSLLAKTLKLNKLKQSDWSIQS